MSYHNIIEGLTVLTQYDPTGMFCAEHDEIFAGHGIYPNQMSKEDTERLNNAGWTWNNDLDAWQKFV